MNKENPLKKEKRNKRAQLIEKGIDPYPHSYKRTHITSQVFKEFENCEEESKEVLSLAGRLMTKRDMGKAAFFNIQDGGGRLQCYIKKDDVKEEIWGVWKLVDIGDIVGVKGSVFKTKKGELSLRVQSFQMLCKTLEPLPEKYHGLEDQELKYRFRFLDLIMQPESRKIFTTRSRILQEIRSFMNKRDFVEVETPVLQPMYGGAAALPFKTHHNRLDRELYLKISPELYLKKLLVGGFEKVYEIGKNFRNEGIDRTHNPEFTMMEYYETYTDYEDQMKQFEDLVCYVVEKIKGSLVIQYQGKELNFTKPWRRIGVKEAILEYGKWDVNQLTDKELAEKIQKLNPKVDPVILKDRDQMIMEAFELTAEKHFWHPTFIKDFPLGVSPLTKNHREWKGEDSPWFRTVERFEPIVAKMELGNAYTELNDPVEQKERLLLQEKQRKEEGTFHPMDENFLFSLEVGLPPTGGVGLGIERLVMILTDQSSIRDCILFPILRTK